MLSLGWPQDSYRHRNLINLGLDQNRHLTAVASVLVGDPPDVHDRVHGAVGHLCRPLVVQQEYRREGEIWEVRTSRCSVQIGRQATAQ